MLPEIIGRQRTAEILMLNRSISAQQALDWGLAALIVESTQIKEKAHQLALQIADLDEESITATKRMVCINEVDLKDRLEVERSRFVEQIAKTETQHSMLEFLAAM
jgi:2-(1,2-epoxy-1,2-dihydrophenyl)acetyl-CoA isomerase